MSRTYTSPKCKYHVEDGHFVTDKSVAHKVTGTTMAAILGLSPWATPFTVACNFLGLAREDISGKPSVETGKILEPVVINYIDKCFGENGRRIFLPAEDVYAKRKGDHDSWTSDFEDDVFAGHVDGIVMDMDAGDSILEIKTSSNTEAWSEGVPVYYYWQVALYNEFLTKKDYAYVGLGVVDKETYRSPISWNPNTRNVKLFRMPIDRKDVQEKMEYVRQWYNEYILNGITPDYDPENPADVEMYNHLCNLARDIEDVKADVVALDEIEARIALEESKINELYTQQETLKDKVKDYMVAHNLSTVEPDGVKTYASISKSVRSTLSANLLMEAGIDPQKYTTQTETNIFKIKARK